ncbi:hypothetical protein B0H10DRAFT_2118976 [Mycena sp. CBHHK59/15]|nr:hypothetical protein B0H10DRAFT_2118976 [Mycena sp. CBHHK59/15]
MPALPLVTFILSGWDLGVCADLILQGVQFAHYVTLYKRDVLPLKLFVGGLGLLTTLKSVQAIAHFESIDMIFWVQNVQGFMDLDFAAGIFTTYWPTELNITLAAIIAFYVQMFFYQRLGYALYPSRCIFRI